MLSVEWILLDTETTGFAPPVFVVELAAQRMRGWQPVGEVFRKLIDHGEEVPPEASRVHGYTKEILARDGEQPLAVYEAFRTYAEGLPLVAYNLEYDLNQVLLPEWQRLGIPPIGSAGFCALRLAQRLLDPLPSGNAKLQTLRQYYRLPERGAHTARGDVETVIDLFQQVLAPLANAQGLTSWEGIATFAADEWYPSRLAFGKHRGRLYTEALTDPDLRQWLEWLSTSKSARSASMGRWYVAQLSAKPSIPSQSASTNGLAVYTDPESDRWQTLVDEARARLADAEFAYMAEKRAVDAISAKLYQLLRAEYRRRDDLFLIVTYRKRYLNTLLEMGEEEADEETRRYEQEEEKLEDEYGAADRAAAGQAALNEAEKAELRTLWRSLVQLYHSDKHFDAGDREVYERLTQVINQAKDQGDIGTLREIQADPEGFAARQGWKAIGRGQRMSADELRELFATVQTQIKARQDALEALKASAEYDLMLRAKDDPSAIERVAESQRSALTNEIANLEAEADALHEQIVEINPEFYSTQN